MGAKDRKTISLAECLNGLNQAYWQGKSTVDDDIYDQLCNLHYDRGGSKLFAFDPTYVKYPRHKHHGFMGSLHKAKSTEDVEKFIKINNCKTQTCLLQPKIDGIAVELVYTKGELTAATTRGDGWQGRNVLNKIKQSGNIPHQLPYINIQLPDTIVLHGELFLRLDYTGQHLKDHRRARYKVAGLMQQKHDDKAWLKRLDFFVWSWVNSMNSEVMQDINQLSLLGFKLAQSNTHQIKDLNVVKELKSMYERSNPSAKFLMDGVVIKRDNNINILQKTSKTLPDHVLAWKFPPQHAVVKIQSVQWSTGKTGRQTAILIFKPVVLHGIKVSKISGGGSQNMKRLGVKPGDIVSIALKGQAIPVLDRVLVRF